MPRTRPRISYANVVSTLALALVLSGGAYAATQLPKNSVGSKQLQKNAVSTKKVKDGSLKAADLEASALDGFMKGKRVSGHLELTPGITYQPLLTVPGVGQLRSRCQQSTDFVGLDIDFENTSGTAYRIVSRTQSEDPDVNGAVGGNFGAGVTLPFNFPLSDTGNDGRYLQIAIVQGPAVTVEVHGLTRVGATVNCSVTATAYAS